MIMFSHKLPWSVVSRQANWDEYRVIDAEGETVVETGANKHLAFAICTLPELIQGAQQTSQLCFDILNAVNPILGVAQDALFNLRGLSQNKKEEDA